MFNIIGRAWAATNPPSEIVTTIDCCNIYIYILHGSVCDTGFHALRIYIYKEYTNFWTTRHAYFENS